MFADGAEHRWIEELGGMNIYAVTTDLELITPELTGSILEGVTRDSILTLAKEFGLTPVERRIGVDELLEGIESGLVSEIFACGTAAVITPVGELKWEGGSAPAPASTELTMAIRTALVDVQFGRAEDTFGWMRKIV